MKRTVKSQPNAWRRGYCSKRKESTEMIIHVYTRPIGIGEKSKNNMAWQKAHSYEFNYDDHITDGDIEGVEITKSLMDMLLKTSSKFTIKHRAVSLWGVPIIVMYPNCMVNTITFKAGIGGTLSSDMTILGDTQRYTSPAIPKIPAGEPLVFSGGLLNGIKINGFEFTVENNLSFQHYPKDKSYNLQSGAYEIVGSVKVPYSESHIALLADDLGKHSGKKIALTLLFETHDNDKVTLEFPTIQPFACEERREDVIILSFVAIGIDLDKLRLKVK